MSKTRINTLTAKGRKGKTNWQAIKSMTPEELNKAIKNDPDSRELTSHELNQFKKGILIKSKLGL